MPRFVSIIVPVYNSERTILRCIESLLIQTYSAYEIILVDNNSEDSSSQLCMKFSSQNEKIRYLTCHKGGVSGTRNYGIREAIGDFIVFVDSDDFVAPDYIKKYVEIMETNRYELVVSAFDYHIKDKFYRNDLGAYGRIRIQQYVEFMIRDTNSLYFGVIWNKCYQSSIIKDYKIYFHEEITVLEDFLFNLEYLFYVREIYVLQPSLYHYIYYEQSLSNTRIVSSELLRNRYKAKFDIYDTYVLLTKKNHIYEMYHNQINSYLLHYRIEEEIRLLFGYHTLPKQMRKMCLQKLRNEYRKRKVKKEMTGMYRFKIAVVHIPTVLCNYIRNRLKRIWKG